MSDLSEQLLEESDDRTSNGTSGNSCLSRGLVLEPSVMLLFFAVDLSGYVIQNEVIYLTCTQTYGFNKSDCHMLVSGGDTNVTRKIETEIQPYVVNILMVRSMIGGLLPVIGALFAGGWSDRFGRKPLILAAFIGYFLVHLFCAILAFFSSIFPISPWLYIPMTMPAAILSADCSLRSGAFAYITDVTDERGRTFRMTIYEAFLYTGIVVGYLLSGVVFRATNAQTVFGISAGVIFIALLLVWFCLKESVTMSEIDQYGSSSHALFNWSLLKDLIETVCVRRGDYELTKLWLIITTLVLHVFVFGGSENVSFLFVREKFGWTVADFTKYEALQIIIQIVGNIVAVVLLHKLLNMSATSIALLVYGSCILDAVIKGMAKYPREMYLAAGVGSLKAMPALMCRLILSLFIPNSEIGKVYSFVSAIQAVTPLASAPFYSELYARTLVFDSGTFNLVSAGFYFICFILMTIVFYIIKRSQYRGSRHFTEL